ncbi:MAG: LemA family protein [Candidatus Sumerlaeota bacterium]|nr:LemA family protein [Candidatus Sumerlaeota bacterium]
MNDLLLSVRGEKQISKGQGWAQADVQLRRRHNLIPSLMATVTGLRGHERNLQTELAEIRAQPAATPGRGGNRSQGHRPHEG